MIIDFALIAGFSARDQNRETRMKNTALFVTTVVIGLGLVVYLVWALAGLKVI